MSQLTQRHETQKIAIAATARSANFCTKSWAVRRAMNCADDRAVNSATKRAENSPKNLSVYCAKQATLFLICVVVGSLSHAQSNAQSDDRATDRTDTRVGSREDTHGGSRMGNRVGSSLDQRAEYRDDGGADDLSGTISSNANSYNRTINNGLTDNGASADMHYDDIVKTLQAQDELDQEMSHRLALKKSKTSTDPFENVWMHGGFGWATSFQSVNDARGRAIQLNQKGIQATLGIDLFSPHWEAESAARSMGDESERGDSVSLKEFDLKILYKNQFKSLTRYRFGGGLSGRYMSLHTDGGGTQNYTTPAAVATFGLDQFFTKQMSVGLETSIRSSLIADTADKTSLDAVMRVDAHF